MCLCETEPLQGGSWPGGGEAAWSRGLCLRHRRATGVTAFPWQLPSPLHLPAQTRRGARQAGALSDLLSFSPSASRAALLSHSPPHSSRIQLSPLKRRHSASRASCSGREGLCPPGRRPSTSPTACTLHSLTWAQPGRLAQRGARDGHCVPLLRHQGQPPWGQGEGLALQSPGPELPRPSNNRRKGLRGGVR